MFGVLVRRSNGEFHKVREANESAELLRCLTVAAGCCAVNCCGSVADGHTPTGPMISSAGGKKRKSPEDSTMPMDPSFPMLPAEGEQAEQRQGGGGTVTSGNQVWGVGCGEVMCRVASAVVAEARRLRVVSAK